MKPYFLISILSLFLTGCVSENEQKGLDYIADLYEAETSYSKSFNNSIGTEAMKKFNVKVSGSERIDTLQPTVTASNIAVLMYESFTEDEKENYTHIDVELINSKNDTAAYFFPTTLLKEIEVKSESYKAFSQSLVDHDFSNVDKIKDAVDIPTSVAAGLETKIRQMEKLYGTLRGYESFGISEVNDEERVIYQFQGYLVFGNEVRKPYFTVADAAEGKNKLIGFRIF